MTCRLIPVLTYLSNGNCWTELNQAFADRNLSNLRDYLPRVGIFIFFFFRPACFASLAPKHTQRTQRETTHSLVGAATGGTRSARARLAGGLWKCCDSPVLGQPCEPYSSQQGLLTQPTRSCKAGVWLIWVWEAASPSCRATFWPPPW